VVAQEYAKIKLKLPASHSHTFNAYRLKREEEEFQLADLLLCPSKFVAKTFLDLGFEKEKIVLHQYGFDCSQSNFSPKNSLINNEQPFNMVFLGSCEPRKGLHYALDAWLASKACHNGTFYICGRYIRGYRELLASKLLHPSVKELGFQKDVCSILQKSHALILPSIEEGSALVTYEARACGCVLLVSEVSGALCRHMHDALVHKVGDVDSLREHIDMVASDRSFYQKLRNNSLAGLGQLTWERAAEILVDIYRKLIGVCPK
jgi:glycosyltransferase involved in cell wall biosynthesis